MHNEHWSEGQSWSCLPHAVACFALTFWIQANVGVAWSAAPLALGLAFMACESGFVWDAEARRGRSYTGWIVRGKLGGMGEMEGRTSCFGRAIGTHPGVDDEPTRSSAFRQNRFVGIAVAR